MHDLHISVPDDVFAILSRQAIVDGFETPEQYVADYISHVQAVDDADLEHLFTPKVIAHLEEISARIRAGEKTYTVEECKAGLAKTKAEWLRNQQS